MIHNIYEVKFSGIATKQVGRWEDTFCKANQPLTLKEIILLNRKHDINVDDIYDLLQFVHGNYLNIDKNSIKYTYLYKTDDSGQIWTNNLNIMKIARPKTEKWHNYEEGDVGSPIDRHGKHLSFYKKGFWKRYDRKKFFRNIEKWFK